MAGIKKAYVEVIAFLEENAEKKVKSILDGVRELVTAKSGGGGGKASNFYKLEDGTVVGVLCYYHKLWMSPEDINFGLKASSPTGLNNMCKDGVSKWTKQQLQFRKSKEGLLDRVAAGELKADDIPAEITALEEARDQIVPTEDGYGYNTLEELCEAKGVAAPASAE